MTVSPHSIIESFTHLHIDQYAAVAALALAIWDYFILLPEEVTLVWPARWNLSKLLFMVNRYLVFVDPVLLVFDLILGTDAKVCARTEKGMTAIMLAGFIVGEIVAYLRAYAVWGTEYNKYFVLVICLFLGVNLSACWVLLKYLGGLTSTGPPAPGLTGCTLFFKNRLLWINFVTGAVLEVVSTLLLIVRAVQNFYQSRVIRSSLIGVMVRDGVFYFIFMLAATIVNLIVVLAAPAEMNSFLVVIERVLYSVLCNRVILNIRGYGAQAQTTGDTSSDVNSSEVTTSIKLTVITNV
ncbi:hypothetical protein BD410DRAFT_785096 [Rickenella mellea]|uniref:DUF6533 domain-containing protein n=1 Tax=Rickenella mellea TaxID=50990 RepID=A0A4Y7QDD0_9AGAM|nr:hypothetical protein BD410DRAFT_785096 [Rickenella mellea]